MKKTGKKRKKKNKILSSKEGNKLLVIDCCITLMITIFIFVSLIMHFNSKIITIGYILLFVWLITSYIIMKKKFSKNIK